MDKNLAYVLQKENNNFDLLRLFAAIMVIYAHSFVLANAQGHEDIFLKLSGGLANGGGIAVKFFFFLSGVLVTNSLLAGGSVKKFVVSRFFRIYPAFIFVVIFTALIAGPLFSTLPASEYYSHETVFQYIRHNAKLHIAFYLPGVFENNIYKNAVNGSLWTIPLEIAAYALLLAAYILTGMKQHAKSTAYLTAVFLLIIILPILNIGDGLFFLKADLNTAPLSACFALGSLFALHKDKIEVSLKLPLGFLILCYLSSDVYLQHIMFYLFVSTFFLYMGSIGCIKKLKLKYDVSYGVYLWGFVVQQAVFFYAPNLNIFVNQAVCIILAIILAIPTFLLIEKPAMNLGRMINKKYKF